MSIEQPTMKHTLGLSFLVAVAACLPARGAGLDFGDRSSATLTTKAWKALEGKDYADAIAYAKKCVELYKDKAVEMQKELKEPVPTDDREAVSKKWALNDVGTCLYITGQALEKQDKGAEAIKSYKELVEKLPFAQCWDPKGWFWKPAEAAKGRIKALEFDSMK
jgi:tetratricopeptide (TPR) repeat protein